IFRQRSFLLCSPLSCSVTPLAPLGTVVPVLRLGFLRLLRPRRFNPLQNKLQPLPAPFRPGHYFFHIQKHFRVSQFLAEFRQERIYLGKHEKHLAAARRPQEQLLIQQTLPHKRSRHPPVAPALAQPVVFLRPGSIRHFQEIVRVTRRKLPQPPVSRFAQFRLAPQLIQLQNQFCILRTRFFAHGCPASCGTAIRGCALSIFLFLTQAIGCRYSAEYRPVTWNSSCRSISASMPLAPRRKRCESSQLFPNSSFISVSHSSDCFAVRIPPAGLKPTAMPVSSAYSRIARVITTPTGNTAFTASFPVEVLMKSAPAIIATRLARATFRNVSKSPVPRITFRCAGPQASLNATISSYSCCHFAPNTCARVITTSISCAPASTERRISAMRSSSGESPAGNPVETAATGIFVPSSARRAVSTNRW